MTIITDPLFYMVAIPALIALGLSKGGFAGVGVDRDAADSRSICRRWKPRR